MNQVSREDQFEIWLMEMSDAIDRFRNSLPSDVSARLDFSPDSLSAIEAYALERYATVNDAIPPTEATALDGLARYVGQVFRSHLGGKWKIDFSDPKNAFHGLPQLVGLPGQRAQICPLTLVTSSLDRRTGKQLRFVFDNCAREGGKH